MDCGIGARHILWHKWQGVDRPGVIQLLVEGPLPVVCCARTTTTPAAGWAQLALQTAKLWIGTGGGCYTVLFQVLLNKQFPKIGAVEVFTIVEKAKMQNIQCDTLEKKRTLAVTQYSTAPFPLCTLPFGIKCSYTPRQELQAVSSSLGRISPVLPVTVSCLAWAALNWLKVAVRHQTPACLWQN